MSTPAERVQAFVDARIKAGVRTGISAPVTTSHRGYVTLEINDLKALLAANDRHNRLVGQVAELVSEVQAHQDQEGVPLEIRTRTGLWRMISDLTNAMVRNMG